MTFKKIPYDYILEVTNRFKGTDLVDRVLKELWMEVRNTVQVVVTKTIPKRRDAKRQNASQEALQIAEEREVKGKGEKERYINLNAEFQKIARR